MPNIRKKNIIMHLSLVPINKETVYNLKSVKGQATKAPLMYRKKNQ